MSMLPDDKKELVKKLLIECNSNTKISYGNFFKFLEFDSTAKQHKKLNDAIADLESKQYEY